MLIIKRLKEGFSDNSFSFGRIMINLQEDSILHFLYFPTTLKGPLFRKCKNKIKED